jgi:hypothetical protein
LPLLSVATTQLMRRELHSTPLSNCRVQTSSQWIARASSIVAIAMGANKVTQAIAGSLLSEDLHQNVRCHVSFQRHKKLIKIGEKGHLW